MTPTAAIDTVSKHEAAEILGISPRRVLEYAQSGALRSEKHRDPTTKLWQVRLILGDVLKLQEDRKQPKPHQPHLSQQLAAQPAPLPARRIAAPAAPTTEAPEIRPFDNMPACVRLSAKESAAYLRVPRSVILDALEAKTLAGIKTGRGWRIKKSDLDQL